MIRRHFLKLLAGATVAALVPVKAAKAAWRYQWRRMSWAKRVAGEHLRSGQAVYMAADGKYYAIRLDQQSTPLSITAKVCDPGVTNFISRPAQPLGIVLRNAVANDRVEVAIQGIVS